MCVLVTAVGDGGEFPLPAVKGRAPDSVGVAESGRSAGMLQSKLRVPWLGVGGLGILPLVPRLVPTSSAALLSPGSPSWALPRSHVRNMAPFQGTKCRSFSLTENEQGLLRASYSGWGWSRAGRPRGKPKQHDCLQNPAPQLSPCTCHVHARGPVSLPSAVMQLPRAGRIGGSLHPGCLGPCTGEAAARTLTAVLYPHETSAFHPAMSQCPAAPDSCLALSVCILGVSVHARGGGR